MNKLFRASFILLTAPIMVPLFLATSLHAADRRGTTVACPVIVDREVGSYSSSKAKYRCYRSRSLARRAGFRIHNSSDDSSCSSRCIAAVGTPTPKPGGVTSSGLSREDFRLFGPGERETTVFSVPNGGEIFYDTGGSGRFELQVMNATSDRRLQRIIETHRDVSGEASFPAHTVPVVVKVDGSSNWTVAVRVK